jgi:hypothetical protein
MQASEKQKLVVQIGVKEIRQVMDQHLKGMTSDYVLSKV